MQARVGILVLLLLTGRTASAQEIQWGSVTFTGATTNGGTTNNYIFGNPAPDPQYMIHIGGVFGDFSPTYHETFYVGPTMQLAANGQGTAGMHIWPTIARQSTGTGSYSKLAGLKLTGPILTGSDPITGFITNLWIQGAPADPYHPETTTAAMLIDRVADEQVNVFWNVDRVHITRNLAPRVDTVTWMTFGSDNAWLASAWDRTRSDGSGSLIGVEYGPVLRMEHDTLAHYSLEVHPNTTTVTPATLAQQVGLHVRAGSTGPGAAVTAAISAEFDAPTVGSTNVSVLAHGDVVIEGNTTVGVHAPVGQHCTVIVNDAGLLSLTNCS